MSAIVQKRKLRHLTEEQELSFAAWRLAAIMGSTNGAVGMPYMARMLFSLRPVDAPGLKTMGVDEWHRCYIDFDYIMAEKTDRWASDGLLHEAMHLFANHAKRGRDALVQPHERRTSNIACFPAGTLLPGNVAIESVATMSRHFDGDLITIDSQAGEVFATPEHPFFARERRHKKGCYPIVLNDPEWVDASDLAEGHYLCVPRISEKRADTKIELSGYALPHGRAGSSGISGRTVRSIPLDTDTAWLIGLYVAEGSSSPSVRFSLGAHEDELIERVEKVASQIGYSASRSYTKNNACAVSLGTTVLGRWLKDHCGPLASEKHIPEVILRHADRDIRWAFVEGLQAGDGYQRKWNNDGTHRHYCIKTASKSLMHDMVLLLAQDGLGCHTSVEMQRPRNIDGYAMPDGVLYGVTFNPDGIRSSERLLNGKTITSHSHRWKADDDGVWYPITTLGQKRHVGPVYNMTTESHTYITHGYLVHNCDAEINDDLDDAGCDMSDDVLPEKLSLPRYNIYEFYLAQLRQKNQDQQKKNDPGQPGGSGGSGDQSDDGGDPGDDDEGAGKDGSGDESDDTDDDGENKGGGDPGDDDSTDGEGANSEGGDDGDGDTEGQGGGSGSGEGEWSDDGNGHSGCGSGGGGESLPCELGPSSDFGGTAPALTEGDREVLIMATVQEIKEHMESKGRGTVPGGLATQIDMIFAPAILDWRRTLPRLFRNMVGKARGRVNTDRNRVRRRNLSKTIIMPGYSKPKVTVAFIRDTSGSVSNRELADVSNEVHGIAKQLGIRNEDLQIIDCDVVAHPPRPYDNHIKLNEVAGRGGTDMRVGIRAAMEMNPKPSGIVLATDGETPMPMDEIDIPIIALLTRPGCEDNMPDWCTVLQLNPDEEASAPKVPNSPFFSNLAAS